MSCLEPVADGMIISINDPDALAFREAIIESLMLNHPHDCPVCDEGGECHLQDMTVMTGHNYRRNVFEKRTHKNQYLGPFINHEMNRCIQCYRCVRFYNDYAGGTDLAVFSAHDHVYFGRYEEGTLENEFSGNLVEVCPTGVFTDKTYKQHYTRKWDLTNAPSVCVHCGVGCNTIAGERYGILRRIMSRYNGSVNGYFLCDRGRFGYEFVNDDDRIRKPLVRPAKDKDPAEVSGDALMSSLKKALSGTKKILGIGSPRASLEANFALFTLVGKDNFFHGISKKEYDMVNTGIQILKEGPSHSPSLKEIEKADAVFILGEDVTNTAPMVALAIRQAARTVPVEAAVKSGIPAWHDEAIRTNVQNLKSPVFIASSFKTKLDDLAEDTYRAGPDEIAELGFAVAALIDDRAPGLKIQHKEQQKLSKKIAATLKEAKNPLIITGIHSGSAEIMHAAANVARALSSAGKNSNLGILFPECNTAGLGMMEGRSLDDAFELIRNDGADTLIILENDLYRRSDKEMADGIFDKCGNVIVLDHLVNRTTSKADILVPVGTFAESEGTLVNHEGRAQRFYRVFPAANGIKESWRWIGDMMGLAGKTKETSWQTFDEVVTAMAGLPYFSAIRSQLPDADFRMLNMKIKRQTARFSGRTAMNANIDVSRTKTAGRSRFAAGLQHGRRR